jgi:C-terminal processing protease CtpA/Prc
VDALEYLREGERYVAGSPQVRRFRTLNQFGQGELGSVVKLEVQSDGEAKAIEIKREKNRRGYFFNRIGEFEFPTFAEVLPGILYVNLSSMDVTTWEAKLPQLVKARGVIFDQRVDGRTTDETLKYIEVHADVIPHLIDQTVQASPMLVPRITQPDRLGWSYRESTWPVQPKAPRLQGKIVFINEPSVVSYGETCTAMIVNYHLATLVGEPTAGTNGNVNFIPLPGGLRVMWTGMDVRKHDRTSFYGVGFAPDVPGRRTIEGVRQGRDEYLELAIEVIERAASLSVPGTPH